MRIAVAFDRGAGPVLATARVRGVVGADMSAGERHVRRPGKIDHMEREGFEA